MNQHRDIQIKITIMGVVNQEIEEYVNYFLTEYK
jgi:hypothetical protein